MLYLLKKILIVSSDRHLLGLLKYELSFRGYTVLTERNANLTFRRIKDFIPDLFIVDLILDDNNGGTISHQVKGSPHFRDLPVIILSDYELKTHYQARFGCDKVIRKSNDIYPLIGAIHDLLEQNRPIAC